MEIIRTKEGVLLDADHPSHEMYGCAGYREGLECCINKPEVLNPILKEERKKAFRACKEAVENMLGELEEYLGLNDQDL